MVSALSVAKFAVTGIVGIGTGKIVGQIIKNNVAAPETLIDKVTVTSAAWVIGALASKTTKNHVSEIIDEIAVGSAKIAAAWKLTQKLERINAKQSTFEQEGLRQEDFTYDAKTNKWEKKKVTKCGWCPDRENPDPKSHPDGQLEHIDIVTKTGS